jgi:RNA polymerase sigma-70 factor, ECF subfamily
MLLQGSEDVAQTIFMKLWIKRAELSRILTIEAYLFTMVKNQYLTEQTILRRKKALYEHVEYTTETVAHVTEQDVAVRETRRILDEGVYRLPRQMKMVMTLKLEGYNRKQISLATGTRENTVKNHIHVALARMEDCLQVI